MKRNAMIGGLVWCGLSFAVRANRLDLSWIELLLLFALLVIVPMGFELTARIEAGSKLSGTERIARYVQLPTALFAVASYFCSRRISAAAFVVPWIICCGFLSLGALVRIARGAFSRLGLTCTAVAFLYISVGTAWLLASRLGLTPIGFQEPIVLLTAVHFHYAGFAAPLLAQSNARALASRGTNQAVPAIFKVVAAGILLGPAFLAAGFIIGPRLKLVAAVLLVVSVISLALSFLPALREVTNTRAKRLIGVAAASALFLMALAGLWAVGDFPLQSFVHLNEMARFHGTANAFGFTLCGLLGWILATAKPAAQGGTRP